MLKESTYPLLPHIRLQACGIGLAQVDQDWRRLREACVAGALFSSFATFLQLGLIVLALHPPSLAVLITPLAAGALVALASAGFALLRQTKSGDATVGLGQPFNIPHALGFATLLTAVTIAVSFAQAHWGTKIAALGAALAGVCALVLRPVVLGETVVVPVAAFDDRAGHDRRVSGPR